MPDTERVSLRKRAWQIVEVAHKGDTLSHRFDVFILALIVLNVIAAIASTVQSVADRFARPLAVFEVVSVLVFTVEYLTRVWSCVEDPRFRRPLTGRLRFMITPMAMIDFLAVMPFYLGCLKLDLRSLRILRLVRFLRVASAAG